MEVNRGVPAALLVKAFRKEGHNWQIMEEIRAIVDFRRINLIDPWPVLWPMDIVMLRNVLIYFEIGTKQVLDGMAGVLAADGYLFLGSTETTLNLGTVPRPRRGGSHHLLSPTRRRDPFDLGVTTGSALPGFPEWLMLGDGWRVVLGGMPTSLLSDIKSCRWTRQRFCRQEVCGVPRTSHSLESSQCHCLCPSRSEN